MQRFSCLVCHVNLQLILHIKYFCNAHSIQKQFVQKFIISYNVQNLFSKLTCLVSQCCAFVLISSAMHNFFIYASAQSLIPDNLSTWFLGCFSKHTIIIKGAFLEQRHIFAVKVIQNSSYVDLPSSSRCLYISIEDYNCHIHKRDCHLRTAL